MHLPSGMIYTYGAVSRGNDAPLVMKNQWAEIREVQQVSALRLFYIVVSFVYIDLTGKNRLCTVFLLLLL